MQSQTITWPGGNGRTYTFELVPIQTTFTSGYVGNYIFCKQVGGQIHAVYIGEGDLQARTLCHKAEGNVFRRGATHICFLVNTDDKSRYEIEEDLLLANPEAYESNGGCNIKKGG